MKKCIATFLLLLCCAFYTHAQDNTPLKKEPTTAQQAKKVTVFPNPASNVVHVLGLRNTSKATIIISDVYGNAVQQHQWAIKDASLSIPIPNLEPGIYVISISSSAEQVQTKFYKQ